MRLELEDDGSAIVLSAPTTAGPLVRMIPGIRHNAKRQVWLLPLSWASCVTARGVLGAFEIGPRLKEWAGAEAARVAHLMELRTAQDALPEEFASLEDSVASEGARFSGAPRHLRPDQRAGAAFLATAGSALLGDQMRLGKTPQTIRAMQMLVAQGAVVFPALVVSPNSVTIPWAERFAEWWPEARVVVAGNGTANARKAVARIANGEADVLVLNYEALPNLSRLAQYGSEKLQTCSNCDQLSMRKPTLCHAEDKELNSIPWRTVIADEVHRVANPGKQTRALWAVADDATYRFGLTGSPPEDPAKFWTVMRFIDHAAFPAKTAWTDRYALKIENIWSGFSDTVGYKPETRAELDKIVHPRFIRRTRAMVFPDDLPPIYMPRYAELTGKQLAAYNAFRKDLLAQVDSGVIYTSNPLTKLLRLRQLAAAYGEATEKGGMVITEPSSKLDVFMEVLEELGSEQAVVFAESKQLIDLAAARLEKNTSREGALLRTYGRITGGQSPEERAESVALFQDGKLDLLLCTVAAGGEGLTMNSADTAIFLQRPWSAQLNTQAESRIVLPGMGASTTIIDIQTRNTVEESVANVLKDKANRLEELVQDANTLRRWLS